MAQLTLKLPEVSNSANLPFADYEYPRANWNGLVLVGEAPGAEEARLGRPFVGRSGQLLDKTLEKAGLNRNECLIANVFRFQPPANKIDHFFASRRLASAQNISLAEHYGKFGSHYCKTEFASELDHLSSVLKKQKPRSIIALGRTPLWALTGENGLLEKAGRFLSCRLFSSAEVIPTFHPSFILRGNWNLQDEWLRHFQLAKGKIV